MRAGASEVYVHGMPGGQYTNLREQARSLGIDDTRWPEVARAYAQVNEMFGDIVKVTPTSKVVGDMALHDGHERSHAEDVPIPQSRSRFRNPWSSLFRGDLGQPYGGFPPALQKKVLKGAQPLKVRPGETLPPIDLAQRAASCSARCRARSPTTSSRPSSCIRRCSPTTWRTACTSATSSVLPTPTFFYGLEPGEEIRSTSSAAST